MTSITIDREGFIANIFLARKGPCRVASTANISSLVGEQTIDGVAVVANDRVLVKDQTDGLNAIYTVKTGAWELAQDFDQRGHVAQGAQVFVVNGTTNAQTEWFVSTTGRPWPGREAIQFTQFAATDLAAHLSDASDAHDASAVSFSATGSIASTDVQAAIAELDGDITALDGGVYHTADKATDANVRAATADKVVTADRIESASALVTLTDAATIAVDWDTGINFQVTLTTNRVLGNPTNGQPGTWRTVLVKSDGGPDTLTFGNQYGGEVPTIEDVTTTQFYLLMIYCKTSTQFLVSAIDGSDA